MCGYLAEHVGEPQIYISALILKYEHLKQFEPACIIIDDAKCSEIVEFFSKILQYPKDLGLIHSACAGIHYISLIELNYSQKLVGTELSKWQKKVALFTEFTINTLIGLMNHKWMIENIYKSCILATYYLLKLAIRANDKSSVLKILKFSNNFKGKLNDFHIELFKELLLWATSINTSFGSEYEDMVLRCIEILYLHNSELSDRIANIFTISFIHKLSCKKYSFYNLLSPDDSITFSDVSGELYVTNDMVHKIIRKLDLFKLFLSNGPKNYFDSSRSAQDLVYHNLPTGNILLLAINAIKIAKLNIKKQFETHVPNEELITFDDVFITKAKMNLVPAVTITSDMWTKLYTSAIDLTTSFINSFEHDHITLPGDMFKSFMEEVFCCANLLECQKMLFFFGEPLSKFLSFLLRTSPLLIPINMIDSIFDIFVNNQLELLVKTTCKDLNLIFTIGKYSLEIACIVAKFVSENVLSNLVTNISSTIIRAQESIIRVYLIAIKFDDDGWQREFIHKNINTILSFIIFSTSGYLAVPNIVSNNFIGLFKLYNSPLYKYKFKHRVLVEDHTNLTREESASIIKNYHEVWYKMIELYSCPQLDPIKQAHSSEKKDETNNSFDLQGEMGSPKDSPNDIFNANGDVSQAEMNYSETVNAFQSTADHNLLVDRMRRRSDEIKKIRLK